MSTHKKVMEFINLIKGHKNQVSGYDAHDILERIYQNGNCYMFAKTLQFVFPQGELYMRSGWSEHVALKVEDKLYDITGEIDEVRADIFYPITEEEEEEARTWCYSEYHDHAYGLHDENNMSIEKLAALKLNDSNTGWDIKLCH